MSTETLAPVVPVAPVAQDVPVETAETPAAPQGSPGSSSPSGSPSASPSGSPSDSAGRPALSLYERRVLGVLVEKAKTTPDVYPLSLNALVTGSNQKSNREPVLNLAGADVEAAVAGLKQKGYVQQIQGGGRVDKFRHTLYESLKVDKVQLAVLAELLLRGPQTEGELRSRASRMEPIPDLEVLRGQLRLLAERGLVAYLVPEGRRGTTVTHGFHTADELERLRAGIGKEAHAPLTAAAASTPAPEMVERVQALEQGLAELREQVRQLQAALGRSS